MKKNQVESKNWVSQAFYTEGEVNIGGLEVKDLRGWLVPKVLGASFP